MDHIDDERKFPEKFEETPWIYPLISKGELDIMDLAGNVAANTGVKEEAVKETLRLYLKIVAESLRAGNRVEFLGMGCLTPVFDEDGELVSVEFEESERMRKIMDDMVRKNPSLN